MLNKEVVAEFVGGGTGWSRNLMTDGRWLWSYNERIAVRMEGGVVGIVDPKCRSRTTMRHVGLLRSMARLGGLTVKELRWDEIPDWSVK